jgi:predicted Rossmann fold nucleotide-binding protein DprA/Smf involved in DNA uptake
MKIAIIGSRTFRNWELLQSTLESFSPEAIVSGGAKGADTLAKNYAIMKGIKLIEFLPNYAQYGRSAPIMRNFQIIDSSDQVIAFWDGKSKGTLHSINHAKKTGKEVVCIYFQNSFSLLNSIV